MKTNIKSFINNELRPYSNEDNVRSIPSIIDGFKDAQRKAIYGMFKYGNEKQKISRLSGFIALDTAYAHGETSMCGTLVGLAQTFPGSNNANLLEPMGQFGTRLSPEPSSSRYISTMKSKWFDLILDKEDSLLLNYKEDEGMKIEPESYYPIIPLWLVNGVDGIGTGYRSYIIQRKLSNIITAIKSILNGNHDINQFMVPYFNDWNGTVVESEIGKYELHGSLKIVNTTTIEINELPVGYTVDKFKAILIKLLDDQVIKDYDNNSTEESFKFIITCPRELTKKGESYLMKTFKLVSKDSDIVTMWDVHGNMKQYSDVIEAMIEFVLYRLEKFDEYKSLRIKKYEDDINYLKCKFNFCELFIRHDMAKQTYDIIEKLIELADDPDMMRTNAKDFLNMPIRTVTVEKCQEMLNQINTLEKEKEKLAKKSKMDLYLDRLNLLEKHV